MPSVHPCLESFGGNDTATWSDMANDTPRGVQQPPCLLRHHRIALGFSVPVGYRIVHVPLSSVRHTGFTDKEAQSAPVGNGDILSNNQCDGTSTTRMARAADLHRCQSVHLSNALRTYDTYGSNRLVSSGSKISVCVASCSPTDLQFHLPGLHWSFCQ